MLSRTEGNYMHTAFFKRSKIVPYCSISVYCPAQWTHVSWVFQVKRALTTPGLHAAHTPPPVVTGSKCAVGEPDQRCCRTCFNHVGQHEWRVRSDDMTETQYGHCFHVFMWTCESHTGIKISLKHDSSCTVLHALIWASLKIEKKRHLLLSGK